MDRDLLLVSGGPADDDAVAESKEILAHSEVHRQYMLTEQLLQKRITLLRPRRESDYWHIRMETVATTDFETAPLVIYRVSPDVDPHQTFYEAVIKDVEETLARIK